MSASWVCPGGLPDVSDRQRTFYPSVEGKMSYMSVRVSLSMGYLMDRLYVCQCVSWGVGMSPSSKYKTKRKHSKKEQRSYNRLHQWLSGYHSFLGKSDRRQMGDIIYKKGKNEVLL